MKKTAFVVPMFEVSHTREFWDWVGLATGGGKVGTSTCNAHAWPINSCA